MFRKTGGSSGQEELQTTGGGSGGGTVDQGNAGADPWLMEIDPSQLPLPVLASIDTTGLATEAKQDVGNASLASIDSKLTNPVPVSGPLTDAELRASNVNVAVNTALPAGTNAIGKLAANSGVDIGDVDVTSLPGITGNVADDSAANGDPVAVAGFAKSPDGTDPGNVSAEDDVARLVTTLQRILLVENWNPSTVKAHFDGSSAYTDQQIAAAPGVGYQIVIDFIQFSSGAATAINLFLEEGSTKIFGPIYLEAVAGRGYVSGRIRLKITANTAVTFTTSASIAQSVDFLYHIEKV